MFSPHAIKLQDNHLHCLFFLKKSINTHLKKRVKPHSNSHFMPDKKMHVAATLVARLYDNGRLPPPHTHNLIDPSLCIVEPIKINKK
jgi:hypothetical protein